MGLPAEDRVKGGLLICCDFEKLNLSGADSSARTHLSKAHSMTLARNVADNEVDTSHIEPDHFGKVIDISGGHDIIECSRCGFRHASPLPTAEELEATYAEDYYTEEKPDYLVHAAEDAEWAQLSYDDRLNKLHSLLGYKGRLLDIGSGPGFFLERAASTGWDAQGIEPSCQASQFAKERGLTVTNEFFGPETASKLGQFDAIVMTNMLEHVPAPIELVEQAFELLCPGGVVCVTVPNDYSGFQTSLREGGTRPWWLAAPHHLNYFDFDSLERLLTRVGGLLRGRMTSFPMEMFALLGDDYIAEPEIGRGLHNKRKHFDQALNPAIRESFYASLSTSGLGREAIVFAQKPE